MSEETKSDLSIQDGDLSRLHISDRSHVQNGLAEVTSRQDVQNDLANQQGVQHDLAHQQGVQNDLVNHENVQNDLANHVNVQNDLVNHQTVRNDQLEITYECYSSELQMPDIMRLIQARHLVYRFFLAELIHNKFYHGGGGLTLAPPVLKNGFVD